MVSVIFLQVIAKHMTLGRDYTVVEPGIVCREGESVQVGRCVCKNLVSAGLIVIANQSLL